MANLAVLSLPSMMMRIEKLTYKLQSKINRFGGDKPLLLEANFMKNERIIDRQIKEAVEQSNPRSLGFSIKTVRFTKLISKVYTTHIFIIGRKKGWDILVTKNTVRLHSGHLVRHGLWEDVANKTNNFTIVEDVVNDIA